MASETIIRPRVFLDVQIGTEPAGRLVIELFVDKAPRTCENFRALCAGSNPSLSYKLSPFHRVIDEFMIQGGDITKGNGTGGQSIYGDEFEDENIGWREIDREGLVCMANRGKDTNSSQFFITLAPCPHLNAKHTVFGQLVAGQQTLDRISKVSVDKNDRPYEDVLIERCGELERRKKAPSLAQPPHTSRVSAGQDRMESGTDKEELRRGRKRRRGSPSRSSSRSPPRRPKYHDHRSEASQHNGHREGHEQGQGRRHGHARHSGSDSRSPSPSHVQSAPTEENKVHDSRRRSDDALDSTLRGRPRQRSTSALDVGETDVSSAAALSRRDTPAHNRHENHRRSRSGSPKPKGPNLQGEIGHRSSGGAHHERARNHERHRSRSRRRSSSPSRSRSRPDCSSSQSRHLRRRGSRSRGRHGRRRRHFDEHELERERLDEELQEDLREEEDAAEDRYEGVIEEGEEQEGLDDKDATQRFDPEARTGQPQDRSRAIRVSDTRYRSARPSPYGRRYHDRWTSGGGSGSGSGSGDRYYRGRGGNYRAASDTGRLSNQATPSSSSTGEIKFKGRGSMKYRERRW